MKYATIVEENKVSLLPVMSIHHLGCNCRTLQPMNDLTNLDEVVDDCAIGQVKLPYCGRMDLDGKFPSHRVAPTERKDLDLLLFNRRQAVEGNLEPLRDDAQTVRARLSTTHPDVRVWGIFDLGGANKLLVLVGQQIVHSIARYERGCSQRNLQLISSSVIITADLTPSTRHLDGQKSSHDWGSEAIQSGVDVPAVEASEVEVIFGRDGGGMESLVVGVLEPDIFQTLVFRHRPIADDLNLGLMGYGLQVGMKDASLRIERLAVAVGRCDGIKSLGQLKLSLRGDSSLVLENQDLVSEQRITNDVEVSIWPMVSPCSQVEDP